MTELTISKKLLPPVKKVIKKENPPWQGGRGVSFHGHNKNKIINKQSRLLQTFVWTKKAFGGKTFKCLSTSNEV